MKKTEENKREEEKIERKRKRSAVDRREYKERSSFALNSGVDCVLADPLT